MNSLASTVKASAFKTVILAIGMCFSAAAFAADIAPPFGIRHYDIGTAPNFTLQDIDGETFDLSSTRGHWVFLHFWASWCGPCKEEMPTIQHLADELAENELEIIMVNTAEDEDTVFAFLGALNVDINSLLDKDGQVTEQWKPRGLPTSFLINPKGEIKYQAIGGREWNKPEYIVFIRRLIAASD